MTDDQPSRLTHDFMTGVLSGYLMGSEDGYRHAQEDMAAHWATCAHIVHANAGLEPWSVREQKRRARLAEHMAKPVEQSPWPDEGSPLPKGPRGYAVTTPWPRMRYLPFERT